MMSPHTILIVDDEDHLRASLSFILQKENYQVETAANAEEALDFLRLHEYDLMFLDLNLPGMNGIELLIEVHKQIPHMPVLILTAHAALESAIQAVRLGARDAGVRVHPIRPASVPGGSSAVVRRPRDEPGPSGLTASVHTAP